MTGRFISRDPRLNDTDTPAIGKMTNVTNKRQQDVPGCLEVVRVADVQHAGGSDEP